MMRAKEFTTIQVDEDWKKALATTALGTSLGLSGMSLDKSQDREPYIQKTWHNPFSMSLSAERKMLADILVKEAESAKIFGKELQHFMAQMVHETGEFRAMVERGSRESISKRYDIRYNPRLALILGNTEPGDGWKYRGRGYIQLTGKGNYQAAEKALRIPLVSDPDLASRPEIAAKIAIWYWKTRVARKIPDFQKATVGQVTRFINADLRGLESREKFFQKLIPSKNN